MRELATYPPFLHLQPETQAALRHLEDTAPGSAALRSMEMGLRFREPLLFAMDAMIRYAKAYRDRWGLPLCDDGVLGKEWFQAVKGIHRLLNGDGAVAMERYISTDSKDNGTIEAMYWKACEIAGMDGDA